MWTRAAWGACTLAVVIAALPVVPALAKVALVGSALAVGLALVFRSRSPAPPRVVGHVVLDGQRLTRTVGRRETLLADLDSPLGITFLANAARDRMVIALTSPKTARYLVVHHPSAKPDDASVRACTVPAGDLLGASGGRGCGRRMARR